MIHVWYAAENEKAAGLLRTCNWCVGVCTLPPPAPAASHTTLKKQNNYKNLGLKWFYVKSKYVEIMVRNFAGEFSPFNWLFLLEILAFVLPWHNAATQFHLGHIVRLLRHKEKRETTDIVLPHPINDNLMYTHRMAIALKVGNSESYCLFYYFIYNVKMIFARVCMDFSAVATLEMPIVVLLTAL